MNVGLVMDIAIEALTVMVLIASPVLGAALATGLIIGILQAATSIQEMTLSFIPKLAVMALALHNGILLQGSTQRNCIESSTQRNLIVRVHIKETLL